jgi:MoaA/NifB/PqqE/SkfB family radical SAM enzyme
MIRASHGWRHVSKERKDELIDAICGNSVPAGPSHLELDLTDRCNVACYFCNQQDLRTKEQLSMEKIREMIDELAPKGLRSVRLSGGGDPLFHREILEVLDYLSSRDVVVDNLTTNGVALLPEIADRLVRGRAREVIVSLNAPDAEQYHRMMKVKPALFDRVVENIRGLVQQRGENDMPHIVVQFLLDRQNLDRLVDMYELGRSTGADSIAIGVVGEIPFERIEHDILVRTSDEGRLEPLLREILVRDKEEQRLQIDFSIPGWNELLERLRQELSAPAPSIYATAPGFDVRNGGCYFAWYTAAVTGNGDVRPCCLMLNPTVEPLGNVNEHSLSDQWQGDTFQQMRKEMREVLLMDSHIEHEGGGFQVLEKQCTQAHACWLKNMFFREDDDFYVELGRRLDETRKREIRWIGTPTQMRRKWEMTMRRFPRLRKWDRKLREGSRPTRIWVKKVLGLNLTDAA